MNMSKAKKFFVILASVAFLLGCAAHGSCLADIGLGETGCECAHCLTNGERGLECADSCEHSKHDHGNHSHGH